MWADSRKSYFQLSFCRFVFLPLDSQRSFIAMKNREEFNNSSNKQMALGTKQSTYILTSLRLTAVQKDKEY